MVRFENYMKKYLFPILLISFWSCDGEPDTEAIKDIYSSNMSMHIWSTYLYIKGYLTHN